MKLKLILFLLFATSCACAQFSTVTATVVDSDGTTWANGSWSLSFAVASSSSINEYNYNGSPLNPSLLFQKGSLTIGGGLSITVYNNTLIGPGGSSWNLTVCPNASSSCGTYNFTAASSSFDISSNLTFALPPPRFRATSGAFGYVNSEVINSNSPGSSYWNVTAGVQRYWTGTAWIDGNGSGILGYPPAGISVSTGSAWGAALVAPTSALVGINDTQTLTNKTVDGVSPVTFGYLDATSSIQGQLNIKASYPTTGIPVSSGIGWNVSVAAPAGTIVGTTDTQVLTNKTIDGVSPTTMGYVDPSSSIQTQLNAKQTALPAAIQITTNTTLIAANTCTTNTATAMTGVTTSSVFIPPTPTTSTVAVTGWGSSPGLTFTYYPTVNTFNWSVCNVTGTSITPGSSLTWNVGAR